MTDARKVADTIAHSPLVKTALFGEDANWGRILAAAGRAGAPMETERIRHPVQRWLMFTEGGVAGRARGKPQATEVLKRMTSPSPWTWGSGNGCASVITCDFSVDYVRINADYRS
jgi:glutamate N-acetyltransferase/amino-acid N-acetyltransferase